MGKILSLTLLISALVLSPGKNPTKNGWNAITNDFYVEKDTLKQEILFIPIGDYVKYFLVMKDKQPLWRVDEKDSFYINGKVLKEGSCWHDRYQKKLDEIKKSLKE